MTMHLLGVEDEHEGRMRCPSSGVLHHPSRLLDWNRAASWRPETNGRARCVPVVRARSGYWG